MQIKQTDQTRPDKQPHSGQGSEFTRLLGVCSCGAKATHTVFGGTGGRRDLCCACYIKAGYRPNYQHAGCMKAFDAGI